MLVIRRHLDLGCHVNPLYREVLKLHNILQFYRIPCELRQVFDGWELCYPSIDDCIISASEVYPIYKKHGDMIELIDHIGHVHILNAQTIVEIITNYHALNREIDRRYINVQN